MNRRPVLEAASALCLLLACSSKRDLGNIPDGGAGHMGTAGSAGTGAGTAGQGGGSQGGTGGDTAGTGAGGSGGTISGSGGGTAGTGPGGSGGTISGSGGDTAGTGAGGSGGTISGSGGGAGSRGGSGGSIVGGNGGGGTLGAAGTGGSSAGTTGRGGIGGTGAAGGSGGSTPRCDLTKPFGAPTVVPNINTSSNEAGAELADDLTLYFISDRPGGPGSYDIYVATRSSPQSSFTAPQATPGVNTTGTELWPRLTHDELTLFYVQYTPPASGRGDIYVTSRSSVTAAFAPGAALAQVNLTDADDGDPFIWRDGEALYFVSGRAGTLGPYDIYVSMRRTDGSYATPQPVSEINSTGWEAEPVVTPDGLTIYWASDRTDGGTARGSEIWRATRSSTSEPFTNLARVPELNSDFNESPNWISPDGCKIYITTTRPGGPGGQDIWEATRPPITSGVTEYPVATASSEPLGMVVGPDGNVWFTEYSAGKSDASRPPGRSRSSRPG